MKEKKHNLINKILSNIVLIIAVTMLLGGIAIFSYPTVSNYFAQKNQTEIIDDYIEKTTTDVALDLTEEWDKAIEYNENLAGEPVHDPFVLGSGYALSEDYLEILSITKDGVLGYIQIPKIDCNLAIYHGTGDEVMKKGVGHIEYTSLPIGGTNVHSVLTGHRGLPSAELFTRLDELEVGDYIYIYVLDEILTYRVYQTKAVLPTELDELQIEKGKDLLTLVTCTPYGINTHRLLIQTERVEYVPIEETIEEVKTAPSTTKSVNYYLLGFEIGFAILIAIVIFILIFYKITSKGKHKK